ncbi:MAG: mecI 4 [Gemmataceae bacterium]|nr:mecI 4 [Gemmataceae bacterium]
MSKRPPPTPSVTDAELRVLQALWDHGPSTIRRLADRLYPGGGQSHYATVQKLLDRLEEEACVARDRSAQSHVFTASISRDVFVGGQIRAVVERVCGGTLTPLLTHLVKTESLSDTDRKELRRLLDARRRPGGG